MNINTSFINFKKKHKNKKNQIIFHQAACKNNKIIENIINNFLIKENSFIFESVEKRRIRGRYTIIGADPDKIWEFNKKKIYLTKNNKKKIIKGTPYIFLRKLIENFNFPLPKNLPPLCSLLVGYFSYDIIRYIEKIPDDCQDDLKMPDIKLMRPKTLIIHDNLLKKIYFIINCYADEKINNYTKYLTILFLGLIQGLMGWYMVMSGLSERIDVSHYRLAAHLCLAVLIYGFLLWTIFDLRNGRARWSMDNFCLKRHGLSALFFLSLTIIWGAFVAGTNGGLVYNTWPLMGGELVPVEVKSLASLHETPAAIQFVHRWIAILAGLFILTFAWRVKAGALAGMTFIQVGLGISTLLLGVPILLAAAHQAGALVLLGLLLFNLHAVFLKYTKA